MGSILGRRNGHKVNKHLHFKSSLNYLNQKFNTVSDKTLTHNLSKDEIFLTDHSIYTLYRIIYFVLPQSYLNIRRFAAQWLRKLSTNSESILLR